ALLFVECGGALRVGTTSETALDHVVDASCGIAAHLLDRGFRLGAVCYDVPGVEPVYPDAGTAQLRKIAGVLASVGEVEPRGEDPEGLARAVERARGFVLQGAPFIVVVTRATASNAAELVSGVRVLRAMSGARTRGLPLLVVHVDALALVPEGDARLEEARSVLARDAAVALDEVARLGARVLRWNPRTQDFLALLMSPRGLG
ncbi:MAG: DUF58 domain-containing protein, partial [Thermoplasmatota archaeon]